mmetsp:Transcript_44376/g.49772  ORF Transcript_44376/g.49772 Transcript_44376/m.49772 type:complete len:96 (+) Transcript_44376:1196-1483(+)
MLINTPSKKNADGTAMTNPAAKNLITASKLRSLLWKIQWTTQITKKDCKNVADRIMTSGQEKEARGLKNRVAATTTVNKMESTKIYRESRLRALK